MRFHVPIPGPLAMVLMVLVALVIAVAHLPVVPFAVVGALIAMGVCLAVGVSPTRIPAAVVRRTRPTTPARLHVVR